MDISDNLGVYVCGKQYPDASEAREIHMEGPDVLTSSQARQLGLTKLLRLPPAPLWRADCALLRVMAQCDPRLRCK